MSTTDQITHIHETVLYAPDLDAAAAFYQGVTGLRIISRSERGVVFRVNESSVLIVFNPERAAVEAPGHRVPPHGATGPGHIAFTVPAGSLNSWRESLRRAGVGIELERSWDPGGRSIYFRDPAGNSVELIEGRVWPD